MVMMSTPALIVAIVALLPLVLYLMYSDLKTMRIPNWVCLAIFVVFLATGSWGLPLDVFAWRVLHGVIALVVGVLIHNFAAGNVGGGDLKMIAAITPFIPGAALLFVLLTFALASLGLIVVHVIGRKLTRGRRTGWKAFDQALRLPVGVALGVTIVVFLGYDLSTRLA